jgi:hypothetical protein
LTGFGCGERGIKLRFGNPYVENQCISKDVMSGILDFFKEYRKRPEAYSMFRKISGWDAISPFMKMSRYPAYYTKFLNSYRLTTGILDAWDSMACRTFEQRQH